MSKEATARSAMKLALDYIVATNKSSEFWLVPESNLNKTVIALREELAKPDFWEGYVPEPVKPAQCKYPKCIYPCPDLPDCRDAEQPAQRPIKTFHGGKPWLVQKSAQQEPFGYFKAEPFGWTDCAETEEGAVALYERPAQQEPVAYLVDGDLYYPEEIDWETLQEQGHTVAALYTSPPTLSLAQRQARSADTWVGLTDGEIMAVVANIDPHEQYLPKALKQLARAIEAAIKENT